MFFEIRDSCPACKSKDSTTIYSCDYSEPSLRQYLATYYSKQYSIDLEYLKEAKYVLERCNNCQLVYQKEIPNAFLSKKLYEEWLYPQKGFSQGSRMQALLDLHSTDAREIMMLIAYIGADPENLFFLDVGMGWGSWCLMAKAFGINPYGIELSEHLIEVGKTKGINMITWDDLDKYEFDFINTEQFFEHVPKPLETLERLSRSLKEDGLLKISVPDGTDVKRHLRTLDWKVGAGTKKNSVLAIQPLEHINCYNRFSLIKMGQRVGFEQVKIPMCLQYVYSTNWRLFMPFAKNLVRPFYFNVLQKGTYLFFRKKNQRD